MSKISQKTLKGLFKIKPTSITLIFQVKLLATHTATVTTKRGKISQK